MVQRLSIEVIGTEAMLDWIKAEFDLLSPTRKRGTVLAQVRTKYKQSKVCAYSIGSDRALVVAEALLKLKLPRLWRKWDKVKTFRT